ncbi:hypothetical protein ACUNDV_24670, partial [Serratia sp. IR-2025]
IHSDGSFEGLGCVLANTNLNVLTAVFYWFTLKRDEPFFIHPLGVLCRGIAVNPSHFSDAVANGNWRGRWRGPSTRAFA